MFTNRKHTDRPDSRFHLLLTFVGVAALRAWLLLTVYHDPEIYHTSTRLDVVLHSHFTFGILDGEFFRYDVNGVEIEYPPVLPLLAGLFALPLNLFGLPELHATFVAVSILMGLASLGLFFQLSQYKLPRAAVCFIVILNPIDTIGVLPWGGFSMTMTSGLTAFAIYLYRRYQEEERKGFFWLCLGCMVLSASIHRTGLLVQGAVLTILLANRLLDRNLLRNRYRELLVIAAAAAILLPVFLGRVMPLVIATPLIEEQGLLQKISFTLWNIPTRYTLVFFTLCAVGLISRLRHRKWSGSALHYPSTPHVRLDIVYLVVGLAFYMIPLQDLELSTRFFAFFVGIIYYFFAYSFNLFAHPAIKGMRQYAAVVGILVFCALWHSTRNILEACQSIMVFFRDGLGQV